MDDFKELLTLLKKVVAKKDTGSDYTGTVTRVQDGVAYVKLAGADISDTPVQMTIDAKPGDTVRVRVSNGQAWITGNDTLPPTNDTDKIAEVQTKSDKYYKELSKRLKNVEGGIEIDGVVYFRDLENPDEQTVINGGVIQCDELIADIAGSIAGFTVSSSANTGTSAQGGHCMTHSLYAHSSDATYEYEVGLQSNATNSGWLAFYVKRINKGAAWSTATDIFWVTYQGSAGMTAGQIGPWTVNVNGLTATQDGMTTYLYYDGITFQRNILTAQSMILNSDGLTMHNDAEQKTVALDYSGIVWSDGNRGIIDLSLAQGEASARVNCASGRNGKLSANASNFGLYDIGNSEWVIVSFSNKNVVIPHPLYFAGSGGFNIYTDGCLNYDGTRRYPIGSRNNDTYRVNYMASDASRLAISAQWGASTNSSRNISVPSSDIRLKDNIKDSTVEALGLVEQIQVREFDWKDGRHQNIGFVADELEELDPKLSVGGGYTDDGEMDVKSVDTFYLLGYAVKAIQELSDKVTALEERVAELEGHHGDN